MDLGIDSLRDDRQLSLRSQSWVELYGKFLFMYLVFCALYFYLYWDNVKEYTHT